MGILDLIFLISSSVVKPLIPGIFSSKKIRSNLDSVTFSIASTPELTAITSNPLFLRKSKCGFKLSISSSAHKILAIRVCINLVLPNLMIYDE